MVACKGSSLILHVKRDISCRFSMFSIGTTYIELACFPSRGLYSYLIGRLYEGGQCCDLIVIKIEPEESNVALYFVQAYT